MKTAFAALALLLASACATGPDLTPTSGVPVDAKVVTFKDQTFNAGDHVRIKNRAGTFKPADTSFSIDVSAGPGQTGIVLGGMKRKDPTDPNEPIQVVLIRFDPQEWTDVSSARAQVPLEAFEAVIHAEYIELVK